MYTVNYEHNEVNSFSLVFFNRRKEGREGGVELCDTCGPWGFPWLGRQNRQCGADHQVAEKTYWTK